MSQLDRILNPDQLRRAQLRFRRAAAYKRLFSTPDGRLVLADLVQFSNFNGDPFLPSQPDATANILGMHRIIKRIMSFLVKSDSEMMDLAMSAEREGKDDAD